MTTLEAVGDADHVGFGQERLEEFDLGAAGVLVTLGDREHGTVVLGQAERAVRQLGEIGQVPILIKDPGNHRDFLRKWQSLDPEAGAGETSQTTLVENAGQQLRILILYIGKELVR